jgi:DNA-binding winged helix-turn-helix (wHTH) protein
MMQRTAHSPYRKHEPDSQLSITASALLYYFLRHTDVISRDEVLKVWDDNGLTSSNSNLNQYLSMLRKTFRHYDIENIIVTVSRGMLQLNPN